MLRHVKLYIITNVPALIFFSLFFYACSSCKSYYSLLKHIHIIIFQILMFYLLSFSYLRIWRVRKAPFMAVLAIIVSSSSIFLTAMFFATVIVLLDYRHICITNSITLSDCTRLNSHCVQYLQH